MDDTVVARCRFIANALIASPTKVAAVCVDKGKEQEYLDCFRKNHAHTVQVLEYFDGPVEDVVTIRVTKRQQGMG